ncbi:MAG: hypothetical protein BWY61_01377 [Firmicutes bacterium ADurb.Bin354]|nr:MAG: hypothetical protein BWY61_01377 [Firmicutes bacterium ADurb.Bin354]
MISHMSSYFPSAAALRFFFTSFIWKKAKRTKASIATVRRKSINASSKNPFDVFAATANKAITWIIMSPEHIFSSPENMGNFVKKASASFSNFLPNHTTRRESLNLFSPALAASVPVTISRKKSTPAPPQTGITSNPIPE